MNDLASFDATFHGRVQGVSFRIFAQQEGLALGLSGWVHNLPGGEDIQVVAEGEKEKLEKLLRLLKIGPPAAEVESSKVCWGKYSGQFSSFRIRF